MRRIAATVILTLGTLLGVIGFGAGMASAQPTTQAATSATTADCYPGCQVPAHGHKTPTPPTASAPAGGHTSVPTTVVLQAATTPLATGLAFTGTDAVATVIFGLAVIAGGGLLVQLSRRRHNA